MTRLHPDHRPKPSSERRALPTRMRLSAVLLATLAVCGYAGLWTYGTQPVIGDEARYFRNTLNCFEAPWPNIRVARDPAYPEEGPAAVPYWWGALWQLGLALVWKMLGSPVMWAAQVYHTTFFFALGIFTYLCGRELYGRQGGWWAWVLVLTVPMNLLFAMTFYLEVPVLAFTAAAFYCLLRRRAVLMGLAMAGMFLVKSTTASVLIPPTLVAAVVLMGDRWPVRLRRTGLAVAVMLAAMAPDLIWRSVHFGHPILFRYSTGVGPFYPPSVKLSVSQLPAIKQTGVPLNIFNPVHDLQMFGVSGLVVLLGAVAVTVRAAVRAIGRLLKRGAPEAAGSGSAPARPLVSRDVLLCGLPLVFYLIMYAVMLRRSYDVRYLQAVTLPAGLLLAGRLATLRPFSRTGRWCQLARFGTTLLLVVCGGQLLATPSYVHVKRQISEQTAAAYRWIRRHTEPEAHFLYLEENLTTLTGRPIFWSAAIPHLFFTTTEPNQTKLLNVLGIDYIAINPSRVCEAVDPSVVPTGYPREWVESLARRPYLERVYPAGEAPPREGDFLIYRVRYDKMPDEWFDGPDGASRTPS